MPEDGSALLSGTRRVIQNRKRVMKARPSHEPEHELLPENRKYERRTRNITSCERKPRTLHPRATVLYIHG